MLLFVFEGQPKVAITPELVKGLGGRRVGKGVEVRGYHVYDAHGAHFHDAFLRPGGEVAGDVYFLPDDQLDVLRQGMFMRNDYVVKRVRVRGKETVVFVGRPSSIRAEDRIEQLCRSVDQISRLPADSDHYVPAYLRGLDAGVRKNQILKEERARGD
jgi:hypothetical protein